MGSRKITSKQYFRTAKMIHLALLGGIVLFAFVVSYLMSGKELSTGVNADANTYYALVGVFCLLGLFGGDFIFKLLIKKAKSQPALAQKMMQYQSANIVKYALIESVALFAIVAALLTLSVWFLVITGFLVLVLASYFPSIEKTIKELELNTEEQKQVHNPDAYISEVFDNHK